MISTKNVVITIYGKLSLISIVCLMIGVLMMGHFGWFNALTIWVTVGIYLFNGQIYSGCNKAHVRVGDIIGNRITTKLYSRIVKKIW